MIKTTRRSIDSVLCHEPAQDAYRLRSLGASLYSRAWACAALLFAASVTAGPALPPLPQQVLQQVTRDEASWNQFLNERTRLEAAARAAAIPTTDTTWPLLDHLLPGGRPASNPLLLTDGTVLVHVSCTSEWFKLTPTTSGSYLHGTWSQVASMGAQNGTVYAPRFFASAVLPDGRVIVEGGEYNGLTAVYDGSNCTTTQNGVVVRVPATDSSLGAIYDPVADVWTPVAPPPGWTKIGDASGMVLTNGQFLLADILSGKTALLDPTTLTWTATGGGKIDRNDEENWTLLPSGDVLTVDAYTEGKTCGIQSELYLAPLGPWARAGSTKVELAGCSGSIPTFEAPTQILRPNGTVIAFGSSASTDDENLPVHTATYDPATATWTRGRNMPAVAGTNYTMADAPAAIFPDGNVLLAASPTTWGTPPGNLSTYPAPVHLFGFGDTGFAQFSDIADSAILNSYELNFLVLPTSDILLVETDAANMELIAGTKTTNQSWAPAITSVSKLTMSAGGTYSLDGTQLAGVTSGAAYGDDVQASTNYPLVRIVNNTSHHVFYARTFNFTSVSVAPGTASSTSFTLPETIEGGASSLAVVTNGVASKSVAVKILIPELTLTPAACTYFPQAGGTQGYTVKVQNAPPGLKLGFDWHLLFGNSAAQGITLTVPGSTIDTTTNPPSYLGFSKNASVKLAAFPGPGFGRNNDIYVGLMYQTAQGKLQTFVVNENGGFVSPSAMAQFAQGATTCP